MGFLKRAWKGESKLWKVFWLLGLVLMIPSVIVMSALPFVLSGPALIAVIVLWILVVNGYQMLCIWKCAFNCGWKGWAYIARILVVLGAAGWIMQIAGLVLMSSASDGMKEMSDAMSQFEEQAQQMENAVVPQDMTAPDDVGASVTPEVPAVVDTADVVKAECIEKLRAYAIQNGADADVYVAQSQTWLDSCVAKGMAQ